MTMPRPMPDNIWALDTDHLGRQVSIHNCLDSTNALALSLSNDPTQHGLVILAREQSAGRGQYGRSWQAPAGSSVLLSVLLFPPPELRRPVLLTAWAAVAVCETITHLTELDARIKWPNDVLIHGKKVCGILIEQRTTGMADFPLASVVGIGLNVTQSAELFEQAGLPDAASLGSISGKSLTSEDVARNLIGQLDQRYHHLVTGDLAAIETPWKERLGLVGQAVVVECVQHRHHGRLLEAAFGGLQLESAAGEVVCLPPEMVRHIESG
ncbi:MAG: biotin--[acetyl-CoA-carboxylase] ligase [Planctomycetes bacterium]|nr:biotin--[acetyl-CoA-carboxylase] ligase [Planctomycetota bacterium]